MERQTIPRWLFATAILLGAGSCGVLTQGTIGYVSPAASDAPAFAWEPVPGAVAYQVIVSLDRAGTSPVGTSPLVTTTQLAPQQIAWHAGHPLTDRAYFWVMRAFDRNDPRGVLLDTTEPLEVHFPAPSDGLSVTYGDLPAPSPISSTAISPLPTNTPATATSAGTGASAATATPSALPSNSAP